MELVEIDIVSAQTLQTLLTRLGNPLADCGLIRCIGADTLIGPHFRRNNPLVASTLQGLADDSFPMAIAIGFRRIEQVDA